MFFEMSKKPLFALTVITSLFSASTSHAADAGVCGRGYITVVNILGTNTVSTDPTTIYVALDETGFKPSGYPAGDFYNSDGFKWITLNKTLAGGTTTEAQWELLRSTLQAAMLSKTAVRIALRSNTGAKAPYCQMLAKNVDVTMCINSQDCNY